MKNLHVVLPEAKHDLASLSALTILMEVQHPEIAKPGVIPEEELVFHMDDGGSLTVNYVNSSVSYTNRKDVTRTETFKPGMTASFLGSMGLLLVGIVDADLPIGVMEAAVKNFYAGVPSILKSLGYEGKTFLEIFSKPLGKFEEDTLMTLHYQQEYIKENYSDLYEEI